MLKKSRSFISFVLECFEDLCLKILLVGASVSLIIGTIEDPSDGWIEGLAIFVTVFIVVTTASINNYLKEKKFEKLNAEAQERYITVLRENSELQISVFGLLVGDIIKIHAGDIMPVDGLVVWSMELKVDESTVTGEANLIKKSKEAPFLLSGSQITDGNAFVLVLTVGKNTFLGKNLEKILSVKDSETPLQKKLNYIAELIGKIGLGSAIVTLMFLLGYIIYDIIINGWSENSLKDIVDSFIIAITIVVVAVPEGLPLAVTLSLAYSVNQMKKKNNLVRHLDASETMGQATCICSDKTGTLTQNIMKVVSIYTQDQNFEKISNDIFIDEIKDLLVQSIFHNTTANFSSVNGKDTSTGNRTEIALIKFAMELGYNYENIRNKNDILAQSPFNSTKKRMDTVVKVYDKVYLFVKGSSELILDLCKYYINKDGMQKELNIDKKHEIYQNIITNYAAQAYRTLAIAYKELENTANVNIDEIEDNLTLLAIVGIEDPVRDGVPDAISICQGAGISVRMVTGDNIHTAIAVAKKCRIIQKDYSYSKTDDVVLLGEDFRIRVEGLVPDPDNDGEYIVKNVKELSKILRNMKVLARSSPEDKFILVTGLRQLKEVVAVTGDGSNDAPALKKSNVGFAMHLSGTQLAQEASDIILLDDNFSSILTALLWGRNIYDAISKFIQFQLTVNVMALVMCFIGAAIVEKTPLTAVQMLWVNMIMDSLAALALATEPPNPKILKRAPVKHTDSLLTLDMIKNITGQAIYQLILLVFILFFLPDLSKRLLGEEFPSQINSFQFDESNRTHFTIFFQAFVLMQIFNLINCRKLKSSEANVFTGFFDNKLFISIFIATIIVQYLLVEFGGVPLKCTPLTLPQHIFCLIAGIGALLFGILFRFVPLSIFICCKIPVKRINSESIGSFKNFIRKESERSILLPKRKSGNSSFN
jgi:P-type Ca2+ transporter type 2B